MLSMFSKALVLFVRKTASADASGMDGLCGALETDQPAMGIGGEMAELYADRWEVGVKH